MSCLLPHVLVLINLFRRPALLLGEAASRVVVLPSLTLPACLPRALLLLRLLVPSLYSSGGTTWCASALFAIDDAMLMSCGYRADIVRLCVLRFACVPSAFRPAPSTRVAGRGTDVIVAYFRISTVSLVSMLSWRCCLLVSISSV